MSTPTTPREPWYRPMVARSPAEEHRTSTPLELLFDLCFVVAVAQAGLGLENQIVTGHAGQGVFGYLSVFFAIWWAWMNFSWFASAYDTDDVPYRLTVLVQIAGSLVLSAGVGRALADNDYAVVTWGYVVMRLALVGHWLRAAAADPTRRGTALRYAGAVAAVQVGWLIRLTLPPSLFFLFFVLVALELAIPAWAERGGQTSYHPEHIAERYGLFTVIVLGEAVTAAALAVRTGMQEGDHGAPVVGLAAAGLLLLFSMWWLYFDQPESEHLTDLKNSLFWGYLHYFVFASVAAVGAGLSLAVAYTTHAEQSGHELGHWAAALALTAPVAVYLSALMLLHRGEPQQHTMNVAGPVAAILVLASSATEVPVQLTAGVMVVLIAVMLFSTRGRPRRTSNGRADQ